MKHGVAALSLLIIAWMAAIPVMAATMHGVVIVVIDGDTVLFKPDHYGAASRAFLKIRLADIDAPERDQPYGDAARHAVTTLVLNQQVELTTVATDAYGRTIARVRKGGMRVDEALVRRGLAWPSTRARNNPGVLEAQREARNAQRGLWADASPTPPWVWRRMQSAPVN